MPGHQQLPCEGVGLLLGKVTVAVPRAQEVVAELMANGEALSDRRVIGIDLDHVVAHEPGAEASQLVALTDREPAPAGNGVDRHVRLRDLVITQYLAGLVARVAGMRAL